MNQLAQYLKEREGFDCLIGEECFASYRINGEECYIKDIWVHPDFRSKGLASELAKDIAAIAKRAGCTYLSGSVSGLVGDPSASTLAMLTYGFKISSIVENGLLFRKDL